MGQLMTPVPRTAQFYSPLSSLGGSQVTQSNTFTNGGDGGGARAKFLHFLFPVLVLLPFPIHPPVPLSTPSTLTPGLRQALPL